VEFVMQRKLPTIFQLGEGVRGGGLMEFGPKNDAMFRRTAAYIDKLMVPTRLSSRLKSRANSSSKSI
jgi:hypothetical protein